MIKPIYSIQDFFLLGMKRTIPELYVPSICLSGHTVILAAGEHGDPEAVNLDLPEWDADTMHIPLPDDSAREVRAFHLLEHLDNPIFCLSEIQRVLKPGGVANLLVPHWKSDIAYSDFTHKRFYGEEVWKHLLDNKHYSPPGHGEWKLDIHLVLIIGIVERNLAMMVQLVKH